MVVAYFFTRHACRRLEGSLADRITYHLRLKHTDCDRCVAAVTTAVTAGRVGCHFGGDLVRDLERPRHSALGRDGQLESVEKLHLQLSEIGLIAQLPKVLARLAFNLVESGRKLNGRDEIGIAHGALGQIGAQVHLAGR